MNQQSTDRLNNETPDDVLERAIASIQEEAVPAGPSLELMFATYRSLRESEQPIKRSIPFVPTTKIMRFITTAAALSLAVSMATLFSQMIKSPPLTLARTAFGQALKQVREAHSMSYAESMTIEGKRRPIKTKVVIAEDGRERREMPGIGMSGGIVTIFDTNGFIRLTLIEDTKTAMVGEEREDNGINAGQMFLAWLNTLKNLGDKPDKELGEKELEGKQVTGFVATQGNRTFTMWVDDATKQPVRIEYDSQVNDAAAHVIMSDFRFDEKLDESLFSLSVPAGYKIWPKPKPNDLAAKQVLDQMTQTYANCKSYQDSGVVTTLYIEKRGNRTEEKSFETAFVRPGPCRYEYWEKDGNDRKNRFIIWAKEKEVQTWWDIRPGIKNPESLELALGGANGVSGGSSINIPPLLLPKKAGPSKLDHLSGTKLLEDANLDQIECFHVEGTYGDHPITLWIDKQSYLVRRIDEQYPVQDFRVEKTTTYDPIINEEIPDNLLEFDPPVAK